MVNAALQCQRNRVRPRLRHTLAWLAAAALAAAAVPGVGLAEPKGDAEPVVGLDRLLRLPDGLEMDTQVRGGDTRAQWRSVLALWTVWPRPRRRYRSLARSKV